MRKKVFGRQLKRDKNERTALFKNLIAALVLHDRIETTTEKAKAIRSQAEKLVTKAKKYGDNATYHLQAHLSGYALQKMIQDVAPRFVDRNGGYTRIIKTKHRVSDNAALAIIEWTESARVKADLKKQEGKEKAKQADKKITVKKKTPKKRVIKKNEK